MRSDDNKLSIFIRSEIDQSPTWTLPSQHFKVNFLPISKKIGKIPLLRGLRKRRREKLLNNLDEISMNLRLDNRPISICTEEMIQSVPF